VRNSRLLYDRVTRIEGDLRPVDDYRHFPSQNCDEVKRVGLVGFLEGIVLGVRGVAGFGSDLDDPEARTSLRRLKRPFVDGSVHASCHWLGRIADP
jgi:hypothetical protein